MFSIISYLEEYFRKSLIIYYFSRKLISFFLIGRVFEKEQKLFDLIKNKKNLNIIDIGVNDGLSSFFFLKKFDNPNLIIFDPLLKISKNKKNNFKKIYEIGLSNNSRNVILAIPYFNFLFFKLELNAYSSILLEEKKKFYEINKDIKTFFFFKKIKFLKKKILLKKLDEYNLKPDLIKIDVEGHENEVILGSLHTIKKYKPYIFVERPSLLVRKKLKKYYQIVTYDNNKNEIIKKINFKKNRNYLFIPKYR